MIQNGLLIRILVSGVVCWWIWVIAAALQELQGKIDRWNRGRRIGMSLPGIIDVIAVYLAVGANIGEAIRRASRVVPEPACSELGLVSKDLYLGKSISEAMDGFVLRTGCHDGRTLALVFQQADRFGNETVTKLQQLAESLRHRRLTELEQSAKAAPVKMLLPLVIFIFPAILIVLFTPVLLRSGLL